MTAPEPVPTMREDDIRPKPLLDEFFARLKRDADRVAVRRSAFVEVACPFCGGDRGTLAFEKEGFRYCVCATCESLSANPRPTPQMLTEYVSTSEAVEFWSTHFYRQTADARREQIVRPLAQRITGIARERGLGPDAAFADVGAGYGLFLQELAACNDGARIVAIEPNARLAAICRGHGFHTVERWVEDLEEGLVEVDLATAFEVLEHVFDPLAFLTACGRLLGPGGCLFFSTLTISGFDLQVLWERSRSISPPQHLNFPSLAGLRTLIDRAGLRLVQLTTPGKLDVDIVRNMVEHQPDVPIPRFARTLAASDECTRRDFQRFLQEHCLSSHLQCLVERPWER